MSKTFKLFLEGGAATVEQGTVRVQKQDIEVLIPVISELTGLQQDDVKTQFVGSTPLVLSGTKQDSGDIDFIMVSESQEQKDQLVSSFTQKFGTPKKIGESIFSFVAPVGDHKVQLDLMFVQSLEWAKFSYFTDPESKYKSGVRNELFHSVLKFSLVPGEDLIVRDGEGNIIAKVGRTFLLNSGMRRVFKIAMPRQDGQGFVKVLSHAQPKEIRQLLDEYGVNKQFSEHGHETADPDKFAAEVFGDGVSSDQLSSAEKVINLIREKMPDKADKILADAARGMEKRHFEIPEEMKKPA